MLRFILSVWLLSGVSLAAQAPVLPEQASQRIAAAVKKEMASQGLHAVAVGIVQNGAVVYAQAFGECDCETKKAATARTIFNWASNSKPLAAVLAMQLVEAGKLDLEADVRKYVPEYPAGPKAFSVRQLLCHQSGIPHYANGKVSPRRDWPFKGDVMDPLVGVGRFADSPLLFEPGARTSYSSYAYVLLSAVIQRAGGQPFAQQVRKRIVEPLGLASFQWDVTETGQADWAIGYSRHPVTRVVARAKEDAHAWKHGAGGFKSNVQDFATWAAGLTSDRLLKEDAKKAMWTRQKTSDGKDANYGLGFLVSPRGELTVSHGGSQSETKTSILVQPNARRAIVLMSNCGFADLTPIVQGVRKGVWDDGPSTSKSGKPQSATRPPAF